MQKTESARKLVLNKETLRNLASVPFATGTIAVDGPVTSCGEPCCGGDGDADTTLL